MTSIVKLIEEAGARAESLPTFARELYGEIETRLSALEAKIAAIGDLNAYVPRASTSAAAAVAVSAKLKTVAKAAAASLEQALLDDAPATEPEAPPAPAPAPTVAPAKS